MLKCRYFIFRRIVSANYAYMMHYTRSKATLGGGGAWTWIILRNKMIAVPPAIAPRKSAARSASSGVPNPRASQLSFKTPIEIEKQIALLIRVLKDAFVMSCAA